MNIPTEIVVQIIVATSALGVAIVGAIATVSVNRKVDRVKVDAQAAREQLLPNSGSSQRDSVNRIEEIARYLAKDTRETRDEVRIIRRQLDDHTGRIRILEKGGNK